MAERRIRPKTIVVVGLGRFGLALAEQLQSLGEEVLGLFSGGLVGAVVIAGGFALAVIPVGDGVDRGVLGGPGA